MIFGAICAIDMNPGRILEGLGLITPALFWGAVGSMVIVKIAETYHPIEARKHANERTNNKTNTSLFMTSPLS